MPGLRELPGHIVPGEPVHVQLASQDPVMAGVYDHRLAVRVKNTATGALRSFLRAHHLAHFAWAVSMCPFTFIECSLGLHLVGFIAWEVTFALYWAAVWGWADKALSSRGA